MNNKQFTRRVGVVLVVLALLLTFLCSNLYTIQYTNGQNYAEQSVAKVAETETVAASRGGLFDRNGKVLVSNKISYQVTLDYTLMGKEEERCATILSLINTAREQNVAWSDTLTITTQPPFEYTTDDPFYTVSTNEEGETVYNMTSLGKLAVKMKWIKDPAEVEKEENTQPEVKEPGLWDKIKSFFGMGGEEEVQTPEEPYRLPTAEELLGKMCKSFGIYGQGKVEEDATEESGETVPTLNIGDMDPVDARAVAGVLYELYYRSKVSDWPAYTFAKDVDIDFITRVKELSLPGVEIETTSVRQYNTEYAAHLLGTVGPIYAEEWSTYKEKGGYTMNDTVGKSGAESAFESYLKGTSGKRAIERNENGKIISSQWLTDSETGESLAPQPGQNVFLTIDIDLQQQVEDILANGVANLQSKETKGAACVVLDVNSGEVLASASYPTYSLATYSQDYTELAADTEMTPLLNRALQGLYPPGSTFKMITAIAGLETGTVEPDTKIDDKGIYTYYSSPQPKCWYYRQYGRKHGLQNVTDAIMNSCNYYFYEVGRLVGIDKLDEYAAMFGLGQKTGIELTESAGVVASPEFTESLGGTWYEGNVLSVAIGQESTQVTPIQLANYIATLVNGGTRYSTHLLKSVKSNDFSQVTYTYEPKVVSEIDIQDENLEAVKLGMLKLTTEGSVSSAFQDCPVQVGAKTGSAQVSAQTNSNAVFVCFAPYDDPQIAVSIAVEHGGSGSELGKIAAQIVSAYFSVQDTQGDLIPENTLVP